MIIPSKMSLLLKGGLKPLAPINGAVDGLMFRVFSCQQKILPSP